MKAVETEYKGCLFRSRLEARWAVFFDAVGIEWEYEPEGFQATDGTRYLPDFYLPKMIAASVTDFGTDGVYVEVKGDDSGLQRDARKIVTCMIESPDLSKGIVLLGRVPCPIDPLLAAHNFIHFEDGQVSRTIVTFMFKDFICKLDSCFDTKRKPNDLSLPPCTTVEPHIWESGFKEDHNLYFPAYKAARSARFEHGHSGRTL